MADKRFNGMDDIITYKVELAADKNQLVYHKFVISSDGEKDLVMTIKRLQDDSYIMEGSHKDEIPKMWKYNELAGFLKFHKEELRPVIQEFLNGKVPMALKEKEMVSLYNSYSEIENWLYGRDSTSNFEDLVSHKLEKPKHNF